MSKSVLKNRRIVIDGEPYGYSVREGPEWLELLIYQTKQPMLRLRQSWVESWGINLYRPRVVEQIIRHYRNREAPPGLRFLYREQELFLELTDLCFLPEEQAEKKRFLQSCARMRARLQSEEQDQIKRRATT